MNKPLPIIVILFLMICGVSSCEDHYNICELPKTVTLKAGFYKVIAGMETPNTVPSFSLSLATGGTLIYNEVPDISTFAVSLNPNNGSMEYYIKTASHAQADTLTIVYNSQTFAISPECGSVFIHNLLSAHITAHTIDSVRISNAVVNTTSTENIRLYY